MKILDKYVVNEMLGPFIFGVATFTILFFAGGQLYVVTKMIAESKASMHTAFVYIINSLPAILVFTFPMAVLLSSLLAFGRFSGESELIAIKAGGISFVRVAIPAIILSLFIALLALFINNTLAPNSMYTAQNILIEQFTKGSDMITKDLIITDTEGKFERTIYARKLMPRKNRMEDVNIQYYEKGNRIRQVFAKDVVFNPEDKKWFLKKATVDQYDKDGVLLYSSKNNEILLPLDKSPGQLTKNRSRRPEEMDRPMLKRKLASMKSDGFEDEEALRKYHEYQVYYHQKIAIPFTCFVFGLFGVPLGVRPHRTSKAIGLGLSIIFIFCYYVLMSVGMAFGRNGRIDPFIAAWIPNLIFGVAGIFLIIQQAKK